jgi:N-glycosylase/DNA lyase
MIIKNVKNFDLDKTITCGQIFRYDKEIDNSYTVILSDRVINIKKDNNNLIINSNNNNNLDIIVREYFDLDRDYEEINKFLINQDNNLKDIIEYSNGLKMIREPHFEVIISYILSANNGVPQIKNALDNISKKYGKKVMFNDKEYYLFPNKQELSKCSIEDLRKLKTGFRDKYIYEFVNKLNNDEISLDLISNLDTESAMKYLMENKGIGEKVASCILLFGYQRFYVFPIDTWVKKYMKENYNLNTIEEITKFTKEQYNKYSAIAIQYMFNSKRNKN